ncbi:MAG TPA: DUF1993 domain-containing protein [Dokdonella sp.]
MSLSMYDASVPVFARGLTNLAGILRKGAAHAQERKIDASAFLGARLYPDMLPLVRQVQIATDHAKNASARLANAERPAFDDAETTFEQLDARIGRTLDYLGTLTPAQFDDSANRDIVLPLRGREVVLKGQPYLFAFAQPNFYFHATAAYAILRHGGVALGKSDFLGPLDA